MLVSCTILVNLLLIFPVNIMGNGVCFRRQLHDAERSACPWEGMSHSFCPNHRVNIRSSRCPGDVTINVRGTIIQVIHHICLISACCFSVKRVIINDNSDGNSYKLTAPCFFSHRLLLFQELSNLVDQRQSSEITCHDLAFPVNQYIRWNRFHIIQLGTL